MDFLALAIQNIGTPMVLCFALGFAAALARSDLSIPEAAAKFLSIYLLFAIGFKGGSSVSETGLDLSLAFGLLAGIGLSASIPLIAFALLRFATRLDVTNAAAVAGHYGSISIVTFVAASAALAAQGITHEGYMVAIAATMEGPAIFSALWLARRGQAAEAESEDGTLLREILLNGSIVLLVGAFAIGWLTGAEGREQITGFIDAPFKGILCLFLLDMGLVAGRGMRQSIRLLDLSVVAFGLIMPIIGALVALPVALVLGLSVGGAAILLTLAASASYIAVPAAMRVALPEAKPSIYLTLSLAITFPFNLTVGIPLYVAMAEFVIG